MGSETKRSMERIKVEQREGERQRGKDRDEKGAEDHDSSFDNQALVTNCE